MKKKQPQQIDCFKLSRNIFSLFTALCGIFFKLLVLCYKQLKVFKHSYDVWTYNRLRNKFLLEAEENDQYIKNITLTNFLDLKKTVKSEMQEKAFQKYMIKQYGE
jgi:hypothetical protein